MGECSCITNEEGYNGKADSFSLPFQLIGRLKCLTDHLPEPNHISHYAVHEKSFAYPRLRLHPTVTINATGFACSLGSLLDRVNSIGKYLIHLATDDRMADTDAKVKGPNEQNINTRNCCDLLHILESGLSFNLDYDNERVVRLVQVLLAGELPHSAAVRLLLSKLLHRKKRLEASAAHLED